MIQLKVSQAKDVVETTLKANLVPFLKGSPGVGKSAIIKEIADKYNLKVIDLRLSQCDPTDLNGFPNLDGKKATYRPMDVFPLEEDEIPKGYSGWLLFLDEFNSAPMSVQASAYKLTLDRQVGLHKLHPKVAIVCAGNLETDNAIVNSLSTALQSRLIHFELMVDHKEWLDWAAGNNIHHVVLSYINFKPNNIYSFKPENPDSTYACPRTWEFASKLLKHTSLDDPNLVYLLSGTLGEGVAREFIGFTKVYKNLPTIQQILDNPEKLDVPKDLSTLFALSGSIAANVSEDNFDTLFKFITRIPPEFIVITLRQILKREPEVLSKSKAYQKWVATDGVKIYRSATE